MREVYLDNAATTRVDERIVKLMTEVMLDAYGNPSSVHRVGRKAKVYLDKAREQVAALLNAQKDEIYFTSGGTESDNMALRGVAYAKRAKGKHIITTQVEHHAILHACEQLEKEGFSVTFLPVDEYGMVSVAAVEAAITPETILISVMYANNEIGTIMPIKEIGALARSKGILFHTDAVQAAGQLELDVVRDNVDLLSMTAHKIHGPKGSGAIYIRRGVRLQPMLRGGAQERQVRPGTEAMPGIAGLGLAAELARENLEKNSAYVADLRDKLISGLFEKIPFLRLNGHPTQRLANNANVSIEYIEGEGMLLSLDMVGIAASSGSACTSGSLDPSHVLLATGLDHATAHGSLRLSLSHETTLADIEYVLEKLPPIVERLRAMSPLYDSKVLQCARAEQRGNDCLRACK